jgi:hypothetical protein
MSQLRQADDFMLIDYKRVLTEETPEAVAECEWLLPIATRLVEREAARLKVSECQLLQCRDQIDSLRVQRALDILAAGGFIAPDET